MNASKQQEESLLSVGDFFFFFFLATFCPCNSTVGSSNAGTVKLFYERT